MAKRKITIEDLAVLVKRGFDQTTTKEEIHELRKEVDRRFVAMTTAITNLAKATDDNFRHVNARLDRIRDDVSDIPTMREELYDIRDRVERLEKKIGTAR